MRQNSSGEVHGAEEVGVEIILKPLCPSKIVSSTFLNDCTQKSKSVYT